MDTRILNILDEDGTIIGEATRHEVHERGLLHAEVHVWFYTPDGNLIFQHRAKDKDTNPDLLDATVGGHVEMGDTYEETALKEIEEETGAHVRPEELIFLRTTVTNSYDEKTNTINHPRRNVYAYCYTGTIEDLRVEEGKSLGFESWPIDSLMRLSPEESARFISALLDETGMEIIQQIRDLL